MANQDRLALAFRHVTVWWGGTAFAGAHDYSSVIVARLDALRRWFQRKHIPFLCFWVREVGKEKGEHWHLLVHCPEHLWPDLRKYLGQQIPKLRKGALKRETTDSKYALPCPGCGKPMDWEHLARSYFLKGGTDPVRERNGIHLCAEAQPDKYSWDQGVISGKRIGFPRVLASGTG